MASDLSPVPNDLEFEATIRRLEVTQQVFERYKLLRILGRGGMGVVWLAHDERLERDVALKFLPDEIGLDPEAEDEMKRETRRSLELTHSNIVRIYDFVKDRQAAAISMEFIDGKTLAAVKLERPKRIFEVEELRPWVAQACEALAYAHDDVGVIHRDLKPANFMLTSRGQIKIADFGIAQSISDSMGRMTMRRGTSGTMAYMSPQQMSGELSRVTDDVYALGATIYELLTSKPPFYSGNVSFQVRVMIPPSLRERRDELEIRGVEIPREWEETIAACLGKTAEERPQGMRELSERLGLVAGKAPIAPKSGQRMRQGLVDKWRGSGARTTAFLSKYISFFCPKIKLKSRATMTVGVGLVLFPVAGWAIWQTLVWPLFAPRADLTVNTNPPGAVIHLTGQAEAASPRTFSDLRNGHYVLTVSADGFDPVSEVIDLKPGEKLVLPTIELKRAYGDWAVTTLPAHAHYTMTASAAGGGAVREGTAPDLVTGLPSGTYTLAVSAPGFATFTEALQLAPHKLNAERIDLILSSLTANRDDAVTRAFRNEVKPETLDSQGKSSLAALHADAFAKYLAAGLFGPAAAQLDSIRQLGVDVTSLQDQLETRRIGREAESAAAIAKCIGAHKFDSAREILATAQTELENDAVARLKARFQLALDSYETAIDTDLKAAQNAPAAEKAALIEKLASQYSDDVRLRVASATALTQLPPVHDQLERQVEAFRKLSQQTREATFDPVVLKVRMAVENELRQLDGLANNVNESKSKLDDSTSKIARLSERKADYENRRVGRPHDNPFASTLNFFSKAVTGHSVVDSEAVFASREDKENAISNVQAEIDSLQQSLPVLQAAADEAQKNYAAFVAVVPWGQG